MRSCFTGTEREYPRRAKVLVTFVSARRAKYLPEFLRYTKRHLLASSQRFFFESTSPNGGQPAMNLKLGNCQERGLGLWGRMLILPQNAMILQDCSKLMDACLPVLWPGGTGNSESCLWKARSAARIGKDMTASPGRCFRSWRSTPCWHLRR